MAIRNLPFHAFALPGGMAPNFSPESVAGQNLLVGQNVDGFEQFRSLGKVPGSTRVSDDHGAAVDSLHQFEFTDFDLVRKRQQISLSGGSLRLINPSTGALTVLTLPTGATLTSEAMAQEVSLDRLHLTSQNQLGLVTGGLKYDGTRVTNWGVQGPGTEETVMQALDDSTNWTPNGTNTVADSTISQDGAGSVQINKVDTGTLFADITRSGLSLDFTTGGDFAFVWLFLPSGTVQKLSTGVLAAIVTLGTSGLVNVNNYAFDKGELFTGWNLLAIDVNNPDSTGGAGATESNVTDIRLRLTYSSTGQTQSGVLWDKMFLEDEGAPIAATGGAGNITADVTYRVTYLTEYGVESNAGPASASVSPSSEEVDLTAVPVSSDAQVIARRIYRDKDADNLYRFVGSIDDNSTTTFTDNVADASLGVASPPLAGDDILDNSPPSPMIDVVAHQGRFVGVQASNRFTLLVSGIADPESFRIVDQLQLEEEITGLESHATGTLIYTTDKLALLTGDGVNAPLRVDFVNTQIGANGFRSKVRVKGLNVTVREHEVFLVANPQDPWFINGGVLDSTDAAIHTWKDLGEATLGDLHCVHDRSRFRLVFFGKSSGGGGVYDRVFVYQYGTLGFQQITGEGSGTDPQDVRTGAWFTLSLPSNVNPQCSAAVERTADLPELWVGGNDGYVYWLQDPSQSDYADGLSSAAVNGIFETTAVPIGGGVGGRGEPRALKINARASTQTVWTVTVTTLSDADGSVIDTVSFSVTIGSGNTSPIVPIPAMGSRGNWCKVKMENNTSGGVGLIKSLVLYYIPRGDFEGPRTD